VLFAILRQLHCDGFGTLLRGLYSRKENPPTMNPPARATDPVSAASQVYNYHRLSPELVEQLISIYRTMFPHSTVPDEFYEHVVRKLDDKAVQDQDLSGLLSNGVFEPPGRARVDWSIGRGQVAGASTSRADSLLSNAAIGLRPLLLQ
jgi:hypothetical protein